MIINRGFEHCSPGHPRTPQDAPGLPAKRTPHRNWRLEFCCLTLKPRRATKAFQEPGQNVLHLENQAIQVWRNDVVHFHLGFLV